MPCGICSKPGHNKKTCPEMMEEGLASLLATPIDHSDLASLHLHAFDYMRPDMVAVYLLVDPFTGEPGYVGQTAEPEERFFSHSSQTPKNDAIREWFDRCHRKYLTPPRMRILSVCHRKDATGLEARLIHGLRRRGYRLANRLHNTKPCQCVRK